MEDRVLPGPDVAAVRRKTIYEHIHMTHNAMDYAGQSDIRRLLFSRKQLAKLCDCHKDTISPLLEKLVAEGLLAKERYMLTRSAGDNRWQYLYHITDGGLSKDW